MRLRENIVEIINVSFSIFVVIHTASCIFIFLGKLNEDSTNWIFHFCKNCNTNADVYFRSFYYCVVTMTTIGYGDVIPTNSYERFFATVWMLFGIAFYSFLISFTSKLLTPKTSPSTLLFKRANKLDKLIINNNLNF